MCERDFTVTYYLYFNENVPVVFRVLLFPNIERIKRFFAWLDQLPPAFKNNFCCYSYNEQFLAKTNHDISSLCIVRCSSLFTCNDTDTDTDITKFWVAWLPMRVFILAGIRAEIQDEWVPHPFCPNSSPSPLTHGSTLMGRISVQISVSLRVNRPFWHLGNVCPKFQSLGG